MKHPYFRFFYTLHTPTQLRSCHIIPRHTPSSTDVPRVLPCIISSSPRSPRLFSHHPVHSYYRPTTIADSVSSLGIRVTVIQFSLHSCGCLSFLSPFGHKSFPSPSFHASLHFISF